MLLNYEEFEKIKKYLDYIGDGTYRVKRNAPSEIIERLEEIDEYYYITNEKHFILGLKEGEK